ncbi:SIR2 family protein [Rossellomorea aquimaris]|uniref:SIR2 family protein n=1 Tax=Rossellomorea aquimaris TaxID=189382 RepID=UPI003CF00B73
MNIEDSLSNHLKKFTTAPFLFIGSGFSKRYLNTEDWEGLIRKFCDYVPKGFGYYRSTSNKQWDVAAQLLAEDFHEIWWSDDTFSESRAEFEEQATSKFSPLKIEIAKYLKNIKYQSGINEKNDLELKTLKEVVIDGVITTNWDTLIEDIFHEEEMTKYIGQKQLLFSNNLEVHEIYKIHGCSTDPDSLVLTENDYKEFNSKNAYLAAKLLTIFIEHPVIFIGYSLSDENIIRILESITACLDSSNIDQLKDRLIFVGRSKGAVEGFHESTMIVNGVTIPITRIITDEFDKVYRPLTSIKRKFSTKKLRQMKSEMYELIKHNDPKGKIQVIDYNKSNSDNVEFVVGFGIDHFGEQVQGYIDSNDTNKPSKLRHSLTGYSTYSREDLLREIISDENTISYDYDELLKDTLPEKLKTDHNLPVNRFVKFSTLGDYEELDYKIIKRRNLKYKDFLNNAQRKQMGELAFDWQFTSVKQVYEGFSTLEEKFYYIAILGEQKINLEELKEVLNNHIDLVNEKNQVGTNIRKLFRIYDYLAFGKQTNDKKTKERLLKSN